VGWITSARPSSLPMNLPTGTGRDAFHCVPDRWRENGDAVERVATRFRGSKRKICFRRVLSPLRGENFPSSGSRLEPQNRSAAVSQTSRSHWASAATGFQHSRAPVHGEGEGAARGRPSRGLLSTSMNPGRLDSLTPHDDLRTCLKIRFTSGPRARPRPSSLVHVLVLVLVPRPSSSKFPAKPRTKDEGRGRARGNHTFFRHALKFEVINFG
jgi:hypothetical protein